MVAADLPGAIFFPVFRCVRAFATAGHGIAYAYWLGRQEQNAKAFQHTELARVAQRVAGRFAS